MDVHCDGLELKATKCPFSGAKANEKINIKDDLHIIYSPTCGQYAISESALNFLQAQITKANVEHRLQGHANCFHKMLELKLQSPDTSTVWMTSDQYEVASLGLEIRKRQGERGLEKILILNIEETFFDPVDHSLKAQDFLTTVGKRLSTHRAYSQVRVVREDLGWSKIVDCNELFFILNHLENSDLIKVYVDSPAPLQKHLFDEERFFSVVGLTILVPGWTAIRETNSFPNSNKVFIATAFTWPDDQPCKREDAMQAIVRACADLGYKARQVEQNQTENITNRIIADIRQAQFVICELTYNNRGAYFEGGYARGLGRQVFNIVHESHASNRVEDDKDGKKIHFDLQQIMYRKWRDPEHLRKELKEWIEATVGRYGEKNPASLN